MSSTSNKIRGNNLDNNRISKVCESNFVNIFQELCILTQELDVAKTEICYLKDERKFWKQLVFWGVITQILVNGLLSIVVVVVFTIAFLIILN